MITNSAVGLKAGFIFKKLTVKFRFSVEKKSGGKKARPGSGESTERATRNGRSPRRLRLSRDWVTEHFILC
jgi:hypothetical protein